MPFVHLASYFSMFNSNRPIIKPANEKAHGSIIKTTDPRLKPRKDEVAVIAKPEKPDIFSKIILCDLCVCSRPACPLLHPVMMSHEDLFPHVPKPYQIIVPCGLTDMEIASDESHVIEGYDYGYCQCGNVKPRKFRNVPNGHNVFTICLNNLNTSLFTEDTDRKCNCGEHVIDIEPSDGISGNGFLIDYWKCIYCCNVDEMLQLCYENGFNVEYIARPSNWSPINNISKVKIVNGLGGWERDLTIEGIESNPGPWPIILQPGHSHINAARAFAFFCGYHYAAPIPDYLKKVVNPLDILAVQYSHDKKYSTIYDPDPPQRTTPFKTMLITSQGKYMVANRYKGNWMIYDDDKITIGLPQKYGLLAASMQTTDISNYNGWYINNSDWCRDLTIDGDVECNPGPDYISKLNEHAQKNNAPFPTYSFSECVTDGSFAFECVCEYQNHQTSAVNVSKKMAKHLAAEKMFAEVC